MKRNSKQEDAEREESSAAERLSGLTPVEPALRAMDELQSYSCVKG